MNGNSKSVSFHTCRLWCQKDDGIVKGSQKGRWWARLNERRKRHHKRQSVMTTTLTGFVERHNTTTAENVCMFYLQFVKRLLLLAVQAPCMSRRLLLCSIHLSKLQKAADSTRIQLDLLFFKLLPQNLLSRKWWVLHSSTRFLQWCAPHNLCSKSSIKMVTSKDQIITVKRISLLNTQWFIYHISCGYMI